MSALSFTTPSAQTTLTHSSQQAQTTPVLPNAFREQILNRIHEIFEKKKSHFLTTHGTSKSWIYMYRSCNDNDRKIVTDEIHSRMKVIQKDVLSSLEKIFVILQKSEVNVEKIIEALNANITISKHDETQSSISEGLIHFYCHLQSNQITGMFLSKDPSVLGNKKAHMNQVLDVLVGDLSDLNIASSTVNHSRHCCDILMNHSENELQILGKKFDVQHRTINIPNANFQFFDDWF